MKSDEQTAAAIVADSRNACDETAMESAIVRALQAARTPPPGHIIDDAGVVRKVLGVLPVTADGCVAAPGGVIWPQLLIDNDEGGRVAWSLYDICTGDTCDDGEWLADKCWSTKDAAEAAKEGKA